MRAITATIGWGLFCACSWTWCIGMLLPDVMVRRYGLPGFFVFAIPNVAGCVAFGYVLRDAATSRREVASHSAAATWFSAATISFHLFFAAWLVAELLPGSIEITGGRALMAVAASIGLLAAGLVVSRLPDPAWPWLAVVVYAVSITAFVTIAGAPAAMGAPPRLSPAELAWIAPVVAFGFLLCPFLDLTFHRALQRSPSRHAFAVFGVTFSVMIVMSLTLWSRLAPLAGWAALTHLTAQSVFTVAAHAREIIASPYACTPRRRTLLWVLPVIPVPVYLAGQALIDTSIGEDNYLRFIVFYGLVFPLYVWIFMGPLRPARPTLRALVMFGVLVIAALPCYEAAFIHHVGWLATATLSVFIIVMVARDRMLAAAEANP